MSHLLIPFGRRSPRWFSFIPPYLTIRALLEPRLLVDQVPTVVSNVDLISVYAVATPIP